jgi:hypothetical protein
MVGVVPRRTTPLSIEAMSASSGVGHRTIHRLPAANPSAALAALLIVRGAAIHPCPTCARCVDFRSQWNTATVDGTVNGSLTAFDAPVTISGRVNGDVVVFNGRVALRSGGVVTGDVVSQNAPVVASGATIGGETRRVQTNVNWEGFGWLGRLAWWLAVSVSTLVVGLVLLWLVGRGTAWILGRSLLRPPTAWVVAFLVGWVILRVVALVPILGGLVWFAAVVFGLGALVVAIWRGRSAGPTPTAS